MKLALSVGLVALALLAKPAAAQTDVSVVVGVDLPPVHGTVIVGPRYPARHREVIVVSPRYHRHYASRGLVVVRRGHPHGRGRGRGHAYGHRRYYRSYWR